MRTRSAIAKLTPYVPGERRMDAIKLSSNENPLGCSPAVAQAVREVTRELHIYPDGGAHRLVQLLAHKHGLAPQQVITGNGSDELLTLLAATYLEPGDQVLVGEHTFSQYTYASQLFGATVVTVPMPELAVRPGDYLAHITNRTRIVFLCSPNNPTGLSFTHAELTDFLDQVSQEVLVVVDHAYVEYQTDPNAAQADQLVGQYPNLVVLHTFSKIHGIAALRLGYGLASAERIAEISHVRPPFSVNSVAQAAGRAALDDQDFVQRSLTTNRQGMQRLEQLFQDLSLDYLTSQANFVMVKVPGDAAAAAQFCAQRGVTIRALGSFGLPQYLRITVGTAQQIDTLEPLLRAYVQQHRSS